jgi:hypothetical protein
MMHSAVPECLQSARHDSRLLADPSKLIACDHPRPQRSTTRSYKHQIEPVRLPALSILLKMGQQLRRNSDRASCIPILWRLNDASPEARYPDRGVFEVNVFPL